MDGSDSTELVSTRPLHLGPRSLAFHVVRSLVEADMELILNPPKGALASNETPSPLTIRASHHRVAECLVQGMENVEISMITGYTPEYISRLKHDPAFEELLAHYDAERKQRHVDALDRMKMLGLTAVEEIQERLENDRAGFTKRELLEIVDLALIKGQQKPNAGHGAGAGAGGVAVNVSFVQAPHVELTPIVEVTSEPGGK